MTLIFKNPDTNKLNKNLKEKIKKKEKKEESRCTQRHLKHEDVQRVKVGDLPGGPVAKMLYSHCQRPRLNPWSED